MLRLNNHPFAVEAFFNYSIVLTFAIEKEQIQPFLPICLQADHFQERYAFIAVAMVQTKDLRPKGFPKFTGRNFFLLGYRIFCRYNDIRGKRLRGLYILKSESDKKTMEILGNIFTNYKYSSIDIQKTLTDDSLNIESKSTGFNVTVDLKAQEIELPSNSPFSNWKEARRFAGPLPFTFTYNKDKHEVIIVEGVRSNWKPLPASVKSYHIPYFDELGIKPVLASAFKVVEIPYAWKKGKIEKWNIAEPNIKD